MERSCVKCRNAVCVCVLAYAALPPGVGRVGGWDLGNGWSLASLQLARSLETHHGAYVNTFCVLVGHRQNTGQQSASYSLAFGWPLGQP